MLFKYLIIKIKSSDDLTEINLKNANFVMYINSHFNTNKLKFISEMKLEAYLLLFVLNFADVSCIIL